MEESELILWLMSGFAGGIVFTSIGLCFSAILNPAHKVLGVVLFVLTLILLALAML